MPVLRILLPLTSISWWRLVLLLVLICGMEPVAAQPVPYQFPVPSQSPAVPQAAAKTEPKAEPKTEPGTFQARIDAAALALRDSNPQLKSLSPKYRHCPGSSVRFGNWRLQIFLDSGILFRFKDS